jgi:glycosyltransferase involved in cell wall biosynthesis
MKILHVEPGGGLAGGAQQALYIAQGLDARGIDCVVACKPDAPLDKGLLAQGVRTVALSLAGDADLFYAVRLRRIIGAERPDIVHMHSRRGAVLGMIAAKWAGVPCVTSRRVDDQLSSKVSVWAHSRLNARVVCISDAINRVMTLAGVPPGRLTTIHSSVDSGPWQSPAPRQDFLDEFGLPSDVQVIGVVAQLIPRKGHRYLFRALKDLDRTGLRVVLFGNGKGEAQLQQLAIDLGLGSMIVFAGHRSDLPRWMGNLDLLVHPATMEGMGVALLQASSAGVPIVASEAGGIGEAVRNGINGVLVPPADVVALHMAIRALMDDEARRRQLGRAGRELVQKNFSVDTMVEQHAALYREILAS